MGIDSIAETPLCLAVKVGPLKTVSLLLEAAADVNSMSGRAFIQKSGRNLDTDNYNAMTPLSIACMQHSVNVTKGLLQHRADPTAGNGVDLYPSPLMACLD